VAIIGYSKSSLRSVSRKPAGGLPSNTPVIMLARVLFIVVGVLALKQLRQLAISDFTHRLAVQMLAGL